MSFTDTFKNSLAYIAEKKQELLQPLSDVPEYFNWTRDIFEGIHMANDPGKNALELVYEQGPSFTLTYQEAAARCNQLINYLRTQHIKQGSHVFVMCGLQTDLWVTYLAVIKAGYVMIPASGILSVSDIAYRLNKAKPAVILTDLENQPKIQLALETYQGIIPIKLMLDQAHEDWENISVIEKESTIAEAAPTLATDILFWFFTSGTTGFPKVVAHTHRSYPLGHLSTTAWIGLKSTDKHFNISQPGWAKFAWSCFFAPLNAGATVFCFRPAERFSASAHLRAIEKYQVTTLCAPPTALRLLIQEDLKKYDFSSLRECVSAGEPLNPEVIQAWKSGTGKTIRDGYGQTESTCMIYNLPGHPLKFGSMGKPSFLYDIVIADDNGQEMSVLEEGEIAVKMHKHQFNGIFREYIDEHTKMADVFHHGLYYTGDKAYKDADGYIWFVGRHDDVIKSSDYRIGPFEVESLLLEIPEIQESAVIGSPHPIKGFEIKAFIVLKPDNTPDETLVKKIFNYGKTHIAPYKMPRIIEFVTELPKTISGKIRRVELRALEAERKARGETGIHEFFLKK